MRSKKAIGQNATSHSGGCSRWAHDHVGDAAEAVEREGRGLWGKTGQRSLERLAYRVLLVIARKPATKVRFWP